MNSRRRLLAAIAAAAIVRPRSGIAGERETAQSSQASDDGPVPSLDEATGWLNSPALKLSSLRGKIVLIDFCTFSCINWLRTLPYVRAWATKYANQGVVTIGVHTPEFRFEGDIGNVRHAMSTMHVHYPIAIDNDYAIWNAFRNEYWPALYIIDARGRVRHHQYGEGDYEQSERIIQKLLSEAGSNGGVSDLVSVEARNLELTADWRNLQSKENYLGYERTEHFVSPGGVVQDRRRVYTAPTRLERDEWALAGDWTIRRERATSNAATARLMCRFHARDLHLVIGTVASGNQVRCRVLIDGKPPGVAHGVDIDAEGHGTISEPRLYQLIRQTGAIDDRLFDIEFLDAGVEAYSLTFG